MVDTPEENSTVFVVSITASLNFVHGWEPDICLDTIIHSTIQLVKHLEKLK